MKPAINDIISAVKFSLGGHPGLVVKVGVLALAHGMAAVIGITVFVPVLALMTGDAASVAQVPFVGSFLAQHFESGDTLILVLIGIIFILGVTKATLSYQFNITSKRAKFLVIATWQRLVMDRWLHAPYEAHTRESTARILAICTHDINHLGSSFSVIIMAGSATIQTAIMLTFMAMVSWQAMIGVLTSAVLIIWPVTFVLRRTARIAVREVTIAGSHAGRIHETIKRIELIDIFGTANREWHKIDNGFGDLVRSKTAMARQAALNPVVVQILLNAIVAVLVLHFFSLSDKTPSLASFVLFIGGLVMLQPLLEQLSAGATELLLSGAAYRSIQDVVTLPQKRTDYYIDAEAAADHDTTLNTNNLSFAYDNDGQVQPIVDDLTMSLTPGRLYMLFGASGAGKTTFLRLLQGLIAPQQGCVRIGRLDRDRIPVEHARKLMLTMPQDHHIFSGTVRENLEYGGPARNDDELWAALALANADHVVRALPAGLDAPVGNDGALLSGGQRQRLALARIFVSRPAIMLLDEPTSALDREAEQTVMQSLIKLAQSGTTVVMSTHKIDLAPLADELLWFEKGKLSRGSFLEFERKLEQYLPPPRRQAQAKSTA